MVPGARIQEHASPTHASPKGRKNPSSKRHTPHPAPPSISQDAVPSPPGTKYLSVGAGQRYSDVLSLLLSGMFAGRQDTRHSQQGRIRGNDRRLGWKIWLGSRSLRRGGQIWRLARFYRVRSRAGEAKHRVWSTRPDPGEHKRAGVLHRTLTGPSEPRATAAPTRSTESGCAQASADTGLPSGRNRNYEKKR